MRNDTVTLTINNDSIHPIVKALKITPGAERLGGTWHWTGGQYTPMGNPVTGDNAHNLNDTTFSISVIDDSTIQAWGETLPFNPSFNAYLNMMGYPSGYGSAIWYTPDTIFFSFSNRVIGHHWDVISYHSL